MLSLLLLLSVGGAAAADDGEQQLNQNIIDILNGLDLSELDEYLKNHPDEMLSGFGDSARSIVEYLIRGNLGIDYAGYIGEILALLFDNVLKLLPSFAQIAALMILCAVVRSSEGSVIGRSTAKAVCMACYAVIIASINNLKSQVEVVTPILVTLTVLTGGSNSGAIYSPSALFISGAAVDIVCDMIFPAAVVVIIINFISKLSPELSFSNAAKLIKSILKWVIGITLAIFSIFITIQGTASSLFDGIFFKATQYLVGSSVPIVGNFLSSGINMMVAAGSVIRSSVGMIGIVLLIAEIAPPIILFASFSLILKFIAAVSQPVGESTLSALFSELGGDIEYFIAGLFTVAFMYIVVVMLIINSAVSFI